MNMNICIIFLYDTIYESLDCLRNCVYRSVFGNGVMICLYVKQAMCFFSSRNGTRDEMRPKNYVCVSPLPAHTFSLWHTFIYRNLF